MKQVNKTTAAIVAGSVVTLIGAFVALDAELMGAIQTVLTAALVYLIPNEAAK